MNRVKKTKFLRRPGRAALWRRT